MTLSDSRRWLSSARDRDCRDRLTPTTVAILEALLSRQCLSGALVPESRAVRAGELLYKTPHKLAHSGPKRTETAFNVKKERGWVVWINCRKRVLGRRSE